VVQEEEVKQIAKPPREQKKRLEKAEEKAIGSKINIPLIPQAA
jgi:hypothetical protein